MSSPTVIAKPLRNGNPHIDQLYSILSTKGVKFREMSLINLLFHKSDILHIHWPDRVFYWKLPTAISLLLLFMTLQISKFRGMKTIYTCHNLVPKNNISRRAKRAYFYILKIYVDVVISPRKDLCPHLRKIFNRSRITFIPLGLVNFELNELAFNDLEKYLPENIFCNYILIPGIQEPTKQTELTVDRLLSCDPEGHIVIWGKFPDPKYLSMLSARYKHHSRVVIIPHYIPEQVLNAAIVRSKYLVASQKSGTNSGIVLLSVALGQPCFCATKSIATAAKRDYETTLVHHISDITNPDIWSEISSRSAGRSTNISSYTYSMDWVAEQHLELYKAMQ